MKQISKPFLFLVFAFVGLSVASRVTEAKATGTLALNASQFSLNRLAPGQTSGTAAFQVDDAGTIAIEVTASINTLGVTIAGPHGESLTPNSIGSFGGTFAF